MARDQTQSGLFSRERKETGNEVEQSIVSIVHKYIVRPNEPLIVRGPAAPQAKWTRLELFSFFILPEVDRVLSSIFSFFTSKRNNIS